MRYTGYDYIYGRIMSSPIFEEVDHELLVGFITELQFWDTDMATLRWRQQELESQAIYLSEKYANKFRTEETQYNYYKYNRVRTVRGEGAKGDAIQAMLYSDETYRKNRERRSAAEELNKIFEKLYWTVIRKDQRIRDQQSQDARQGG